MAPALWLAPSASATSGDGSLHEMTVGLTRPVAVSMSLNARLSTVRSEAVVRIGLLLP